MHHKAENVLIAMEKSAKKQTWWCATHKLSHNVHSMIYVLYILKDFIQLLHILSGYTRNSLNSKSVKGSVIQRDKNIKHNTRQINYFSAMD